MKVSSLNKFKGKNVWVCYDKEIQAGTNHWEQENEIVGVVDDVNADEITICTYKGDDLEGITQIPLKTIREISLYRGDEDEAD